MEPSISQNIFVPNPYETDILDELHLYLIDYIRVLEKKLKALKKEVKEHPDSKVELKPQMSSLRRMRQRAYDVLDDLEYKFHTSVDDGGDESSE